MKVTAIIQARMTSSRLPGKILMKVLGKPLLQLMIERVKKAKCIESVVLATTTNKEDDLTVNLGKSLGVKVFRGSEDDVLDRFYRAAKEFGGEHIMRLTGDCPLIDPDFLDELVDFYVAGEYDYASNCIEPTLPDGLDAEIISMKTLGEVHQKAQLASQREHVTLYVRDNEQNFKIGSWKFHHDFSNLRWTVDNCEDFELVEAILKRICKAKPNFSMLDVIRFLENNPQLQDKNAHLTRNEGLKKSLCEEGRLKEYNLPNLEGKRLIIHTNGGVNIGIGHVMRSIGMAQEWIRLGGVAVILGYVEGKSLISKVEKSGIELKSLPENCSPKKVLSTILENAHQAKYGSWVMIDTYNFDYESQWTLKRLFPRMLLVDDYHHHAKYASEIILNQNIGAENINYNVNWDCSILAGTDYVMLRKEFIQAVKEKKLRHKKKRIMVTMGGADAGNITLQVLKALDSIRTVELEAVAIVGPANPHRKAIQDFAQKSSLSVQVLVDVNDMPAQINASDLIVTAGGSSCWEICALEVPMIAIIIAENQQAIVKKLGEVKAAVNLGLAENLARYTIANTVEKLIKAPEKMNALTESAKRLIDGKGVERIISCMTDSLILRPVAKTDRDLIFKWVNDPDTRRWSYNKAMITPEEHEKWFADRLADEQSQYYIAEDGLGNPMGQIRFHKNGRTYEAHVLVAKEFRSKGIGSQLIQKGSLKVLEEKKPIRIIAKAKADNDASIKAFEKAGYQVVNHNKIFGSDSVIMEFMINPGGK